MSNSQLYYPPFILFIQYPGFWKVNIVSANGLALLAMKPLTELMLNKIDDTLMLYGITGQKQIDHTPQWINHTPSNGSCLGACQKAIIHNVSLRIHGSSLQSYGSRSHNRYQLLALYQTYASVIGTEIDPFCAVFCEEIYEYIYSFWHVLTQEIEILLQEDNKPLFTRPDTNIPLNKSNT